MGENSEVDDAPNLSIRFKYKIFWVLIYISDTIVLKLRLSRNLF